MAVIVADDSNFESLVQENKLVIVKYYADWCGTCKLFSPKYKRISEEQDFSEVAFLDVNAEKNPLARKAGAVKNLPTFAIFKEGQLIETMPTGKEEVVKELLGKLQA